MTPLVATLTDLATAVPAAPAITCRGVTLTRGELDARTNRLARAFVEHGVGVGDFVTIALPTGVAFLEAVIATWKAGATPQPVSNRLPGRELEAIVELAQPALVVGVEIAGHRCLPEGWQPGEELSDAPLTPVIAPSLKAPTSGGSTGRPKLIVSTEPATTESVAPLGQLMGIPADGVALSTGPLSHNGPLLTAVAALVAGCHVVVMDRFDAGRALELIGEHGVNWMYSVPTMLSRIAGLPESERAAADLSSLRTVITMAASCSEAVRTFCLEYFGPDVMLELYAATEAHVVVITDGHGWRSHPGSVGRVVVGELEVRDEHGAPVPAGQVGELWVRRSAELAGPYRYLGSEPQRSEDGWESVGDMGWLDDDGWLHLADRKRDMIVVGGSNVYPAEVENALEEHPDIASACVVGLPDDAYGAVVHAVLQGASCPPGQPAGAVTQEELHAFLRERLVAYKIPRTFEWTDVPLRDEAGKVRRSAVAEAALARRQSAPTIS